MKAGLLFTVFSALFGSCWAYGASSLLDKIRNDPDLSQFYDLIERNPVAMSNLRLRSVTIFAPTNEAFQKYRNINTHVQYHMTTTATALDQLGLTITSDLDGNPPLFVTKRRQNYEDQIWINNALVIRSRSNVQMLNENGKKQILHVINDVLTPLTTTPTASVDVINPDAFQFLTHADSLDTGKHRVRSYRQRVIANKKEYIYQSSGGHTFFIPVEEGFKPHPRPEMIDRKVIDGHVICARVLFTAAAPTEYAFDTVAFDDNIGVTISFFTQGTGRNQRTYVKSNTVVGDSKHPMGVVVAEVLRANIPVKNGVVHLIQRPLMIVDTTVAQYLEDKEDGPLHKFNQYIQDFGGDLLNTIRNMKDVTLLAPSNEAWNNFNLRHIMQNKAKIREIFNLHVIRDRLNTDRIRQSNVNSMITQFPTAAKRKSVYFNVMTNWRNNQQTVTVEGAGVNATLIQADIAQTNGYVHIIDRVLGVPYLTILDKLRTDPMLSSTYTIGQVSGFNMQLKDLSKRFTYFVPRDWAWISTEDEFPSTHNKLFLQEFGYHARSILERHLVIADKVYTMADLRALGNDTIVLPTIRNALSIRVHEDYKRYTLFWNHRVIQVFRPDVECTNGIIHVIDHPFLFGSDVHVTGDAAHFVASTFTVLFAALFLSSVAKGLV